MRYYFDFQDEDGHGAVDDDGIEFSTFEEARSAAARGALGACARSAARRTRNPPLGRRPQRRWRHLQTGSIARPGARAVEFHARYVDRIGGYALKTGLRVRSVWRVQPRR